MIAIKIDEIDPARCDGAAHIVGNPAFLGGGAEEVTSPNVAGYVRNHMRLDLRPVIPSGDGDGDVG